MANPTTRAELITHCLRRLGEPVLEVNVDEDQIEEVSKYSQNNQSQELESDRNESYADFTIVDSEGVDVDIY